MFMDEEKFEPDYDEYSASETEEMRNPSKWKETVAVGSRKVDAEEELEDDETTEVKTKHSKKKHKKEKKHHKKHEPKGSGREEK